MNKESFVFKNIPPNCGRSGEFIVEYNTGFLTTGQDWFFLAFQCNGSAGGPHFIIKPNGITDALDCLAKLGSQFGSAIAGAIAAIIAGPEAAGPASAAAATAIAFLLNNESVAGFRAHILRDCDANGLTVIHIQNDGRVWFESRSGQEHFPVLGMN